ncbi:MAG: hypothetical protein ACJAYU_005349 [Bradymonadia bacterium]
MEDGLLAACFSRLVLFQDPTSMRVLAYHAAYEFFYAACILGVVSAAIAIRRSRSGAWRQARPDLVVAGTLAGIAFSLRLMLSPRGFAHETGHAWLNPARMAYESMGFLHGLPSSQLIAGGFLGLAVPGEDALIAMNLGMSSLSIAAMYVLVRIVWDSRFAGTISALTLAFLPLSIAYSGSELALVFAAAVLLMGLAMVAFGSKAANRPALVCGACFVAIAAMTRIETLSYPALGLLVCLVSSRAGGTSKRRWQDAAIVVALPALFLAPRAVLLMVDKFAEGSSRFVSFPVFAPAGSSDWVWIWQYDPFVPTWLCLATAVAFAIVTVRGIMQRDWRGPLLLWGLYVVLQGVGSLVHGGWHPSIFRHQFAAVSLCVLATGPALWVLAQAVRPRRFVLAAVVVAWTTALGASIVTRSAAIANETPLLAEHRFALRALPLMDGTGCLVAPVLELKGVDGPSSWFLARGGVGTVVTESGIEACIETGDPVYFYLGRTCYSHPDTGAGASTTASTAGASESLLACAQLLSEHEWTELISTTIETRTPVISDLAERGYPGGDDFPIVDQAVTIALYRLSR